MRKSDKDNRLFKEGLVSASDFDRAKMQYETGIADVNSAEKEFKRAMANLEAALASKDIGI